MATSTPSTPSALRNYISVYVNGEKQNPKSPIVVNQIGKPLAYNYHNNSLAFFALRPTDSQQEITFVHSPEINSSKICLERENKLNYNLAVFVLIKHNKNFLVLRFSKDHKSVPNSLILPGGIVKESKTILETIQERLFIKTGIDLWSVKWETKKVYVSESIPDKCDSVTILMNYMIDILTPDISVTKDTTGDTIEWWSAQDLLKEVDQLGYPEKSFFSRGMKKAIGLYLRNICENKGVKRNREMFEYEEIPNSPEPSTKDKEFFNSLTKVSNAAKRLKKLMKRFSNSQWNEITLLSEDSTLSRYVWIPMNYFSDKNKQMMDKLTAEGPFGPKSQGYEELEWLISNPNEECVETDSYSIEDHGKWHPFVFTHYEICSPIPSPIVNSYKGTNHC